MLTLWQVITSVKACGDSLVIAVQKDDSLIELHILTSQFKTLRIIDTQTRYLTHYGAEGIR